MQILSQNPQQPGTDSRFLVLIHTSAGLLERIEEKYSLLGSKNRLKRTMAPEIDSQGHRVIASAVSYDSS